MGLVLAKAFVAAIIGGLTSLPGADVSLSIANEGEIRGLLGPNGAGKTSLINTITGIDRCMQGRILLQSMISVKKRKN